MKVRCRAGGQSRRRVRLARVATLVVSVSCVGGLASSAVAVPPPPQLSKGTGAGPQFCGSVVPGTTYNLGPGFDNVYPCGPLPPSRGTAGYGDDFEASPWGFQCTELADRFLWVVYHDNPVFGKDLDGANFVDSVYQADHTVSPVRNGMPHALYQPGDLVSFTGGYEDEGHVAVVIASTENAQGYGVVTTMNENSPATVAPKGQTQLIVSNWVLEEGAADVVPYDFLPLVAQQPSSYAQPPSPMPPISG
ncbi:MAG TPA: CHAP domain-containing protein, partial [Acidimicrobiales bacterium]|nr:CHAP domain-containing protein [Acidimicrobiales bacterium]